MVPKPLYIDSLTILYLWISAFANQIDPSGQLARTAKVVRESESQLFILIKSPRKNGLFQAQIL